MSDFDPMAGEAAQAVWGMFARLAARDEFSDDDCGAMADEIVEILGSERRAYLVTAEAVVLLFRIVGVTPQDLRRIALRLRQIREGWEPE